LSKNDEYLTELRKRYIKLRDDDNRFSLTKLKGEVENLIKSSRDEKAVGIAKDLLIDILTSLKEIHCDVTKSYREQALKKLNLEGGNTYG